MTFINSPYNFGGFHNTTTNTQSFSFDGSADYLERADDSNWDFLTGAGGNPDEAFSFAFWLKRDSGTHNDTILAKYAAGQQSYRLFWSGSVLILDTYPGSGGAYRRRQKTGVSSSAWQHFVISYDGTSAGWKIYINGTLQTGTSTGGSGGEMIDTNSSIMIGRLGDNTDFDLDGLMCQFIAWKGVELDQAAATYLYAAGAAHRDPTLPGSQGAGVYTQTQVDGLLCWLPMDDANGADDHSGSTNGTHNFTKNGNCDVTTGGGNVPF